MKNVRYSAKMANVTPRDILAKYLTSAIYFVCHCSLK